MHKSFKIDNTSIGLRLDKYIKNNIGKLPQSLIEKALRKGNIKLNSKKVKSSTKLKLNDELSLHNFNYKPNNKKDKRKFEPSNKVLKENEELIIDNNQDFLVINKDAGIALCEVITELIPVSNKCPIVDTVHFNGKSAMIRLYP